jgi:SpoVK/Ycf46/Vps4 family AAA+-type ATPase
MVFKMLANELCQDLFRIDLSQVVNKYIGETEKNLRQVFDYAQVGDVILFFNDANSLFGKQGEFQYSHDRYANTEVNHPL